MTSSPLAASQVALVTGGGRGIGRAVAGGLAEAGVAVGVIGRTASDLDVVVTDIVEAGGRAARAVADVTDPDAVAAAVQSVESALGPIDLVVSNAGRVDDGEVRFVEADVDDVWDVVSVNLRGPMVIAHLMVPRMVARGGGRLIHVGSGFGWRRGDGYTGYAVSKGALNRFTVMLAHQHRHDPLVVLEISPGLVRSELTQAMPMWGPDAAWGDVAHMVQAVVAAASGTLDALTGRFLHAASDNVEALPALAPLIAATDARVLSMVRYDDSDPVTASPVPGR